MAVLALVGRAHFAAERVRHELQSVADAEHGQAELEARERRRAERLFVDGRRAARENDAGRPVAPDFIERGGAGQDDGKYFLFADAARDELRVLRAEVEDDDGLTGVRLSRGLDLVSTDEFLKLGQKRKGGTPARVQVPAHCGA